MMLPGAQKDDQIVSRDWQPVHRVIQGVVAREVLHVPRDHGVITEMYRPEWDPTQLPIVHIYQSRLFPGAIGAWSCHAKSMDRLFVNQGQLKLVLYDAREESPTKGLVMEFHVGPNRAERVRGGSGCSRCPWFESVIASPLTRVRACLPDQLEEALDDTVHLVRAQGADAAPKPFD